MSKVIYNKFEKSWIPQLPKVTYDGNIIVIVDPAQTEKAVNYLLSMPILGFDTETRPSFAKNVQYKCSLLQVATHHNCFLFRLNYTGLTPAIVRLLEDRTVAKIGLSWHDDLNALHKLGDFKPGTFFDLQDYVKEIGIEDLSLQKLYANFFGERISKKERLTNWERDILQDKQKEYAAIDAWACIRIYEELMRLEKTGDFVLKMNEEVQVEEEHEIHESV
ncbi:MAG: 3'-5' exonuclease domain-containing protein 2 [Prevotella sp.]|nr:3'-5' exonuclease domain-containing protein 2 [Prevotella sp.]